eukprot:SAG31_NODE_1735_length_7410_cov_2.762960_9_plen_83_part_00
MSWADKSVQSINSRGEAEVAPRQLAAVREIEISAAERASKQAHWNQIIHGAAGHSNMLSNFHDLVRHSSVDVEALLSRSLCV